MLGKRMSLEEIAERLNAEKVPTIHGTNRWTAASVRKGIRFLEAPLIKS
jgi:Recombinase